MCVTAASEPFQWFGPTFFSVSTVSFCFFGNKCGIHEATREGSKNPAHQANTLRQHFLNLALT